VNKKKKPLIITFILIICLTVGALFLSLNEGSPVVKVAIIVESAYKNDDVDFSCEELKDFGLKDCKVVYKTVSEKECKVTVGPLITCKSDDFFINFKYRWAGLGCVEEHIDKAVIDFKTQADCQSALKELTRKGYKRDKSTQFSREKVFTKIVKDEKMLMIDVCEDERLVFLGFIRF